MKEQFMSREDAREEELSLMVSSVKKLNTIRHEAPDNNKEALLRGSGLLIQQRDIQTTTPNQRNRNKK